MCYFLLVRVHHTLVKDMENTQPSPLTSVGVLQQLLFLFNEMQMVGRVFYTYLPAKMSNKKPKKQKCWMCFGLRHRPVVWSWVPLAAQDLFNLVLTLKYLEELFGTLSETIHSLLLRAGRGKMDFKRGKRKGNLFTKGFTRPPNCKSGF